MDRLSWDEYFMVMATSASLRSPVETTKVGAVIVNSDHQILSTGYNGPLSGWPHFRVGGDQSTEEHAERNAIYFAAANRGGLAGATLYTTVTPCVHCARAMLQAGIKRVVTLSDTAKDKEQNPDGMAVLNEAKSQDKIRLTVLDGSKLKEKIWKLVSERGWAQLTN